MVRAGRRPVWPPPSAKSLPIVCATHVNSSGTTSSDLRTPSAVSSAARSAGMRSAAASDPQSILVEYAPASRIPALRAGLTRASFHRGGRRVVAQRAAGEADLTSPPPPQAPPQGSDRSDVSRTVLWESPTADTAFRVVVGFNGLGSTLALSVRSGLPGQEY